MFRKLVENFGSEERWHEWLYIMKRAYTGEPGSRTWEECASKLYHEIDSQAPVDLTKRAVGCAVSSLHSSTWLYETGEVQAPPAGGAILDVVDTENEDRNLEIVLAALAGLMMEMCCRSQLWNLWRIPMFSKTWN